MKKIICFVLAMLMGLSLCACGGGETQQQSQTVQNAVPAVTESSNDTIVFEKPVLVAEDESVKVELLNFYQEYVPWGDREPAMEKTITLKFTNKTDHELLINPGQFYIGDRGASNCMLDGSAAPAAGKTVERRYIIWKENGSALDSIDDLYQLEGDFMVLHKYEDAMKNKSYNLAFSFQAGFNGEVTAPTEPVLVAAVLGETLSTDVVEFTLTGFDCVYHLDPKTYAEKADISGGSLGPGSEMVFANPELTVRNVAKESISVKDEITFVVDYNDGYRYTMEDNVCYIVDAPGIVWNYYSSNSGKGNPLDLSPLISEDYDAYIPAINLIDTDAAATLKLIVTLPTSSGAQEFVYTIC